MASKFPPLRRLGFLAVGLFCVLILAAVSWPYLRGTGHLNAARAALRRGDLPAALRSLEAAAQAHPNRASVQYWLAVANRRAGRLDRFERHLRRASELGWPEDDVRRQRWLAAAQTGNVAAVESQLMETIDRGTSDDVAEEIYEALAKGHLARYRLREAWKCLDSWLHWRPEAATARVLRAGIYARMSKLGPAAEDYRAALEQVPDDQEARVKLGEVLLNANELEEARKHFQSWLTAVPDDPDALLGMGQCERRLGATAEARRHLQAVLARELTPQQRAAALLEQGQLSLGDGKASEAVAALLEAVQLMPAEGRVHYALTTALALAGERDLAKYHADRVQHIQSQLERMDDVTEQVIESPNDAELRYEAGAILIEQGLKKEGAGWLLSALECEPNHEKTRRLLAAEGHFRNGIRAFNQRDLDALGAAAEALQGVDIYLPHMHLLQGMALLRNNRLWEAITEFGDAKDHPDTRALARTLSGEVLYKLEQYGDAQRILITAIQLDPSLSDARRWLAATYLDIGAMNDALEQLSVVAEQARSDPRPLRLAGLIYRDFEDYPNAVAAYRESLRRDPNQADKDQILLELAECLLKQQQHAEALETLRECPRSAQVLAIRAECHYAQGDKATARKLLAEALQLAPDHLDAMQLQGRIDFESNDAESAVRILRQAVEHHPKEFSVRYRLAQAYQRLGQREQAEEQLKVMEELRKLRERFTDLHQEAIRDPANAETRYQLGVVAGQLDKPELAHMWFVAALGMDPSHAGARQALEAEPGSGPEN